MTTNTEQSSDTSALLNLGFKILKEQGINATVDEVKKVFDFVIRETSVPKMLKYIMNIWNLSEPASADRTLDIWESLLPVIDGYDAALVKDQNRTSCSPRPTDAAIREWDEARREVCACKSDSALTITNRQAIEEAQPGQCKHYAETRD